jgi:hypothetical protein
VTDTFAVSAVIDALVSALQPLKSGSPKCFVLDGPLRQWKKSDAVVIGVGRNESASQQLSGEERRGGRAGYLTAVEIPCGIYSWVDGVDADAPGVIKARRDRVDVLFAAVSAVLDADETLGGVCERARLGDETALIEANDGDGARVTLGFTVAAFKTVYR